MSSGIWLIRFNAAEPRPRGRGASPKFRLDGKQLPSSSVHFDLRATPGRCPECGGHRLRQSSWMTRRLLDLLTTLSLLLCVAMLVLWVRSYFVFDAVAGCISETPTSETCVQALSNRGAISLRRIDVTLTGGVT